MYYARLHKSSSSKNILPFFLIYEIKSKIFCGQAQSQKVIHHTNDYGSARIYCWKEICCEGSGGVEKRSYSLSLYFYMSHAMELLDKVRKILHFLAECLSSWIEIGRRDDRVHDETLDYD